MIYLAVDRSIVLFNSKGLLLLPLLLFVVATANLQTLGWLAYFVFLRLSLSLCLVGVLKDSRSSLLFVCFVCSLVVWQWMIYWLWYSVIGFIEAHFSVRYWHCSMPYTFTYVMCIRSHSPRSVSVLSVAFEMNFFVVVVHQPHLLVLATCIALKITH